MLTDRFSNMRAIITQGGGEGEDLTKIGATVTVQAQGGMRRGQLWEGILNDEYAQPDISEQTTNFGTLNLFSENGEVAVYYPNANKIFIYNKETSLYEEINTGLSISSCTCYVNAEGTLWACIASTTLYYCEIDKENFTISEVKQRSAITTSSTSINSSMFLDDYFIICYNSNRNFTGFKYNWETHEFEDILTRKEGGYEKWIYSGGALGSSMADNNQQIKKVRNGEYIITKSQASKFTFDGIYFSGYYLNSTLLANMFTSSGAPYACANVSVSTDLQYAVASMKIDSNQNVKLAWGTFNSQDLTINYIGYIDTAKTYASGVQTSALDSYTAIIDHKYIYDLITGRQLAEGGSNLIYTLINAYNPRKKFFIAGTSSTSYKFYSFPSGTEAQYIITPKVNIKTQANKYYGIASKILNIGDIGEAQLLFGGREA